MDEQRGFRVNVALTAVIHYWSMPSIPSRGGNRMFLRADGQQVKHHVFGVRIPARRQETAFRRPAVTEERPIAIEPLPVHSIVDAGREFLDLIISKILPATQHSTQQDGGINRGNLALPDPCARLPVNE